MTTEQKPNQTTIRDDAARIARQAEAEALLARFAARRAANARLGLSARDSTDILRELREAIAR